MKYAWLVIAVFGARFLVTAIAYPQVDGDLSWQRWLGNAILRSGSVPRALGQETFSAVGASWLPHEWLFAIGAALGTEGVRWYVFAGAVALCAIAALALAAWRAVRAGAGPKAVALCTALAGFALFQSFGVRVQVVAWPLMVLFVLLLETRGRRAWFAVAIAALWSNLHGSAALAPALAALLASGAWLDAGRRVTARVRRLSAITLASLGAICLNPFGWKLPAYSLALLASPIKTNILEWKTTGLEDVSFLYGALPLLCIAIVFGIARREDKPGIRFEEFFTFAVFAVMMLGAARNIALFGLMALPTVALALSRSSAWFAPETGVRERADRIAGFALPGAALAIALALAIGLVRAAGGAPSRLAVPAIAALDAVPGEHRVLCADFAWCGLLVGRPRERVFIDGRADPYPEQVWNDYIEIARLRPAWHAKLDAYGVNAVVVLRATPLDEALGTLPRWHAAFVDKRYRVWLRNLPAPVANFHRVQVRS